MIFSNPEGNFDPSTAPKFFIWLKKGLNKELWHCYNFFHIVRCCQVNYAVILQKLGRSSSCLWHHQPSVLRAPWWVAWRTTTSSVASPSCLCSRRPQSGYGSGTAGSDTGRGPAVCCSPWRSPLPRDFGEDRRERRGSVCDHRSRHLYHVGTWNGSDRGGLGWNQDWILQWWYLSPTAYARHEVAQLSSR